MCSQIAAEPRVAVYQVGFGQGLFAIGDFSENDIILDLNEGAEETKNEPAPYAIELNSGCGTQVYVLHPWGRWINHSCNPNARIDKKNGWVVAMRYIADGYEICVDYSASETRICFPFDCRCGEFNCRKRIE